MTQEIVPPEIPPTEGEPSGQAQVEMVTVDLDDGKQVSVPKEVEPYILRQSDYSRKMAEVQELQRKNADAQVYVDLGEKLVTAASSGGKTQKDIEALLAYLDGDTEILTKHFGGTKKVEQTPDDPIKIELQQVKARLQQFEEAQKAKENQELSLKLKAQAIAELEKEGYKIGEAEENKIKELIKENSLPKIMLKSALIDQARQIAFEEGRKKGIEEALKKSDSSTPPDGGRPAPKKEGPIPKATLRDAFEAALKEQGDV